jgi:hypothetical protein
MLRGLADVPIGYLKMTPLKSTLIASWQASTTFPPLAPEREIDMTQPAANGWRYWWGGRQAPDFVACEIVGPLGIADLVAVRFDHQALQARKAAGIEPTGDYMTIGVLLASRRCPRKTSELAGILGISLSGVRRAIRLGYEIGALRCVGQRHQTHDAWRPAARRLVAVELKKSEWRRARRQATAYQSWADAAWLVLGRRPPISALTELAGSGIGLAYLDSDERARVLQRPSPRRSTGRARVWAAEQTLLAAMSAGNAL